MTDWKAEREDVLARFAEELSKATGDGSKKRQSGQKPPWYVDASHEGAIFSHLTKWKRGELVDPDSGAHPLVHAAWRCLAIACSESGNIPTGEKAWVGPFAVTHVEAGELPPGVGGIAADFDSYCEPTDEEPMLAFDSDVARSLGWHRRLDVAINDQDSSQEEVTRALQAAIDRDQR